MTAPVFIPADPLVHRAALLALNLEYMSWVFAEMAHCFNTSVADLPGMPIEQYVTNALDKICAAKPPHGVFYLLELDGQLAAMGGLRPLVTPGAAEIKRLYVRPAFRGKQLGELALQRLLTDARDFGYHTVCLDSAPFMHEAHRLYEACGFSECPPYAGTEVAAQFHPQWRFMLRTLATT